MLSAGTHTFRRICLASSTFFPTTTETAKCKFYCMPTLKFACLTCRICDARNFVQFCAQLVRNFMLKFAYEVSVWGIRWLAVSRQHGCPSLLKPVSILQIKTLSEITEESFLITTKCVSFLLDKTCILQNTYFRKI